MSYCTSCGHEVPAGTSECPLCGAPVEPPRMSPVEEGTTPAAGDVSLRPLGIGEIVDVAIKIYLRNFVTLAIAVGVVVVPVQILTSLVTVSLGAGAAGFQGFTDPFPEPDPFGGAPLDARLIGAMVVGGLIVGILGFVSAQLALGASFKAVSDAYLGETPDWRTSLRFALGHLGSLLWLAVLVLLVVMGGVLGLGIVVALLVALAAAIGPPVFFLVVPVVLGGVAVGIYLWVSWSVAVPSLLLEDVRGSKALGRSFHLVKSFWWTALAVLVISLLIRVVVQLVFGGVFGFGFVAVGQTVVGEFLLSLIVGVLSAVLATPFAAAVIAVLYFDLRVRKEGFDLEILAQRLGGHPDEPPTPSPTTDPWDPYASTPEPPPPPPKRRPPPDPSGPVWETR